MVRTIDDDKRSCRRVSIELRSLLIFRTIILKQTVLEAARALRINYPAAKMIVQKRKDEYRSMARNSCMPPLDFSEYDEEKRKLYMRN